MAAVAAAAAVVGGHRDAVKVRGPDCLRVVPGHTLPVVVLAVDDVREDDHPSLRGAGGYDRGDRLPEGDRLTDFQKERECSPATEAYGTRCNPRDVRLFSRLDERGGVRAPVLTGVRPVAG